MAGDVKLYNIELDLLHITVRGLSPLITNRFTEEAQEQIENNEQGGARLGRKPRDPEAIMLAARYLDEQGRCCLPAIAFKKAMVRAATMVDWPMTEARMSFQVLGDLLPIRGSAPQLRRDRALVGRKQTTMAYRPEFAEWEVDLMIRYNRRASSAEQLVNLLEVAGFGVGVGAWRPECNGSFGMFEVKKA